MYRKVLKNMVFILALLLSISVFVACSQNDKPKEDPTHGACQHVEEILPAKAPTCTETGLTEGKKCSKCGEVLVAQKKIPAGHTELIEESKAPTCTETGLTEGKKCSKCGEVLIEQNTVAAQGHDYKDYVCTVCGDEIPKNERFEYVSNGDGTCYVDGIGGCEDTDIVIPSISPDGDRVTSIDWAAFDDCSSLTSVVIPDSVTSIDGYAFRGCSSLTSIVIPDSVTSIGWGTFQGCSSLKSVVIPDSVTSMDSYAFGWCSSLESVVIGNGVTSIGIYAFQGCSSLKSVMIPDGVTSIGRGAFYDCSSLTSVLIGNGVTSIGDYAFYGCGSPTSITYKGTKDEWEKISKGNSWTYTGDCIIHCTDGDIKK